MKKSTIMSLVMVLVLLFTSACNLIPDDGEDDDEITYQKYTTSTVTFQDNRDENLANYNTDLYYLNQWQVGYGAPGTSGNYFPDMGDPTIVYDDGYYYAYGTRGTTTFHCFRSADLTNWQRLDDAFVPQSGSWSASDLWAPDIQKIDDKWYLYYTATKLYDNGARHPQIGVAVADKPYGPFVQYTGPNGHGQNITLGDTPFVGLEEHTILDQNVFFDNGKLYMYFSYDTTTGSAEARSRSKTQNSAEIWAVEMIDPVTWDLSTLTPLLSAGYKNFDDATRTIAWETWSPSFREGFQCLEGPYMVKSGDKYILTYCANSFVDVEYSVGYAVSDSPMGPFTKPDDSYLQNMILGVPDAPGTFLSNRYKGFTTGTGHAAIFKTGNGDDYMFAYHAHFNRNEWGIGANGEWRALAVDYLYFDQDGMPYTNGPTYSLQPTPTDVSGCVNLMSWATVRAQGDNVQYLYDKYTNRAVGREVIKETTFSAGTRSIEIKFDTQVNVKAVNVYNSCDIDKSISFIDQIDFGNGNGIVNLLFNTRYVKDDFIFPHSAFNIELGSGGVVTDRIVITISSDTDFSLGEIEIIGSAI